MPLNLPTDTDERKRALLSNSRGVTCAHNWRAFLHASVWKTAVVTALLFSGLTEARAAYAPLFAQSEEDAAEGPSYVVDALLLTLLVGGAVFAVCRAGRRN